nr:retrovirus-related Pol polyprotein from transposon TNT 1-94 [Tanacetum cinerariifolium]
MLDRTDFALWQQRIRLYCRGKDNGVKENQGNDKIGSKPNKNGKRVEARKSLKQLQWVEEEKLSKTKKEWPKTQTQSKAYLDDILGVKRDESYTLINHYTDAKDIWDDVKMLIEGSELTKEDRESQLYDDFEHFRQHKEESINDYYIRGLRESNYDQLFAYLKQHEAHAKENKMVLERLSQPIAQPTADPLALLSNDSNTQHGLPSSSTSSIPPVTPPRQARTVKCYNCNGTGHIAHNCTQPKRPQNSEYFKDKMLLMQAQENGVALDTEQQLFLAGGPDNAFDDDVDEQPVQDLELNVDNVFQAEDCDAFDSDIDEAPTAQTMFMANLSSADPVTDEAGPSYDSNILSEVRDHDQYQDDTCAYQKEHVMHDSIQLDHVVDLHADHEY